MLGQILGNLDEAIDAAIIHAQRQVSDVHIARVGRRRILALAADDLPGQHPLDPRTAQRVLRVTQNLGKRTPGTLVAAAGPPALEGAVHEPGAALRIPHRHHVRKCFDHGIQCGGLAIELAP